MITKILKKIKRKKVIDKIKSAKITGKGGAGFPAWLKWKRVEKAKGDIKYVICNASEGEPGVKKDLYILKHFPETVFKGMIIAMDYLNTNQAYFNFNKNYYSQVKEKINTLIKKYKRKGYDFTVFQETPSYIGGERSALLNAIEGKPTEPRLKPPSPSVVGLFGKPTLIHNVETLFDIALSIEGKYENMRFYTILGKVKNPGVYYLPLIWSVEKILYNTKNLPSFDFFVQIGGGASGEVINKKQAKTMATGGCGSIEVYSSNTKPRDLFLKWFEFFKNESCGKCTPCREGTYQLYNLVKARENVPYSDILEITNVMKKTSFCGLGESVHIPVESYIKNILKKQILNI